MNTPGRKVYLCFATIGIWFALCLQFKISLEQLNGAVIPTLKIFLSYFTVTTNMMSGLYLAIVWLFDKSKAGKFFSRPSVQTAVTVYMLVVGLTYNTVLRGIIPLAGWTRVADELLHVVDPLILLVYWIVYAPKISLQYTRAFIWLIYPLVYVFFIVIRGFLIHQYPYPFIDVTKLGYPVAMLNAALMLVIFWLISLLFIFISRKTV